MEEYFYEFNLKEMIIMANAVCHDEYCELTLNREDSCAVKREGKILIVGGYFATILVLLGLLLYGVSVGDYQDFSLLQSLVLTNN